MLIFYFKRYMFLLSGWEEKKKSPKRRMKMDYDQSEVFSLLTFGNLFLPRIDLPLPLAIHMCRALTQFDCYPSV